MATFAIDLLTGNNYLFNGNFTNSGMTTFSGVTSVNNGLSMVDSRTAKLGGTLTCSTIITIGGGNTAGIEYGGDYSAGFSARSVVDKGYVDNEVSGSTPSWSVITDKPSWLSGATIGAFQLDHTHSYDNLTNILSGGTGISISGNIISTTGGTLSLDLQQVTDNGAITTTESTFSAGLVTGKIRPTGDTITAIQINKANGTTPVINVDTVSGFTGFGVSPTAVVHLKAGTTTVAPLKFSVGSLLSTPQVGAVEFDGFDFKFTVSGSTIRKTFAALEAPQFTGNVNLPTTACLNSINLNNYIWNSGGTNNACLTSRSDFDAYTGSTTPAINIAVTGATNGLSKADCHSLKLGGDLIEDTKIGSGDYDFTICGKCLSIASTCGLELLDKNGQDIEIFSSGGTTNIKGMTSEGAEAMRFKISDTQATFTDSRAVPYGIEYNGDYASTFTNRSLVDKEYVDSHSGGLEPKQAVVAASQVDINLSSAPATIDSITPANGSRVLVKAQSSAVDNGIYIYNGSGATMTRATDYASGSTTINAYMAVLSGVTDANTSWILDASSPITIGVDESNFVMFSSQSGVVQGNGICVTQSSGNYNIAVKSPANCGLCSDASGLYVNSAIAGIGLSYSTGVINIDGSGLAGNSLSWTGNSFSVDTTSGTLSTALGTKLNTSDFNTYSGYTSNDINSRLLTTTFSAYTAATCHVTCADFTLYTGTTAPQTYLSISNFNTYSGDTASAIGLKANITSPTFLVSAFAPTPVVNNSSTCIATTAYYAGQASSINPVMDGVVCIGSSLRFSRQDHIHPSDTSRLAVSAFNTYSGNTATAIGLKANIASPTFTTSANAPTPVANNNSTCIATTAWYFGQSGTTTPVMDGSAAIGTSGLWSHQDHVHPSNTAKANLAGGAAFTGTITVPKPTQNNNTTCVATTSWYVSQAGVANPLINGTVAVGTSLLFSRQDHVHPASTPIYGSQFQYVQNTGTTSTSSNPPIYLSGTSLTTPSLPAGTYKISTSFGVNKSTIISDWVHRLRVNGVMLGNQQNFENPDTLSWTYVTRVYYKSLSGVNTIRTEFSSITSGTVSVKDVSIEIIRVS